MSVIIGYYGKNGVVIAGDKRTILFNGEEKKREMLEELLYSGKIKNDDDLSEKSAEFSVKVHILDDQKKIKQLENTLIGEVRTIGKDSKRKKMYLSKDICVILDIENDNIVKKSVKTGTGIVVFGNKYVKKIVELELKKYLSEISKMDVLKIRTIFEKILVGIENPTLSKGYDFLYCQNAEKDIESIIKKDLNDLREYREELSIKMAEMQKLMTIVNKIAKSGEIGIIKNGSLVLNESFLAIDKICLNPEIYSEIDINGNFKEGDLIEIQNGELTVKGTNNYVSVQKIICNR
ncbi:conserved hypothetical protein [Methanococcus vannielii SB]|uniref:Uncharacterized protein n=1 Tax=Methanococcus vannielii (strain ATCC 35089 / DSM 1224 / JCM 13029 / OCM 148 / SB) TaxID=406327 RepID=A6URH6_METVS|nr:DUF2121 domain-containing protein [Methanococcus vannielii]ABR55098.1 conserved hypothetical protein [Methanococcus vannielii SB]